MPGLRSHATGDDVLARLGQTEEGHRVGHARGRHTGQGLETLQGEALEVRDLLAARVGRGRELRGAGDHVVGLPAVLPVVRLVDAPHEEGGAREQDHGEGELADDEAVAEALMAAISGGAAPSALERPVQIEPQGEEGGSDAEDEDGKETGTQRPAEHAPVDGEHEALIECRRPVVPQPVVGPHGEVDGEDAAGQGQEQGLDDEGTQQPGARGAEGGAHGEFAGAGHGAGEEQVRQVGAGDEQHQGAQTDQHAQDARPVVGGHGDGEGKSAPGASRVGGGILGGQMAAEAREEAFRLRAGEGGGATADEADPGAATVGPLLFGETERPEEVERTQMAPVVQGVGQHAHDLVYFAVDANGAADDAGVAPEARLPEPVTHHEDAVVAQDGFVGTEAAAELGLDPEGGKEVVGDAQAARNLRGLPGLGEVHVRKRIGGNLAVAAHLGPKIEVVGRRDPAPRVLGNGAIDAVQLAAVGIRQRAQQNLVDDAERRRVGTDAESERDDGNEDEAGRATQRPDGEAEIREDGKRLVHLIQLRPPVKQVSRQARSLSRIALHGKALGPGPGPLIAATCPAPDTNRPRIGHSG